MPKLVILRGNSGSGKSTVAKEVRKRMGYGTALIEQDYIRRTLLREKDQPGQPNIRLIDMTVRFSLDQGYNVVLEGILPKKHYGEMLAHLIKDHAAVSYIYYFDIPFEETLQRHKTKPNSHEFGEKEMRQWYLPQDFLDTKNEQVISHTLSSKEIIDRIASDIHQGGEQPSR